MRDVVKTHVKREENRKRKSRRRRHTSLYFFLVVLLVTGIGILLSVTMFFNVKYIDVKGDIDYSSDDVVRMSGIKTGDNLIRLDSEKACKGILSSMIYIEKAVIDKQYPGTVVINVTKCVPTANIEYSGGYMIVSEKGKILETSKEKYEDLIVIKGFEAKGDKLGAYLESEDEQKKEIVMDFLSHIASGKGGKITEIDMSDKYGITVMLDDRIVFEMGNSNEVSYKLSLAETVLEKIGSKKHGTMTMAGANQISFRESQSQKAQEDDNKKSMEKMKNKPIETVKPTNPESEDEDTETIDEYEEYPDDNGDEDWYDGGEYDENIYEDDGYYEEDWENNE